MKTMEANAVMPLFYSNPRPLHKDAHAGVSLQTEATFGFAAKTNAVPVTAQELPHVMQHYPIAFSAAAPATPLAIVGLRDHENLFVDSTGAWQAGIYIPAYVRRYPFIFSRSAPAGDKMMLCVDDTPSTLKKDGGNLLFKNDGAPTDVVGKALAFCQSYQAASDHTRDFSTALEVSGILESRNAGVKLTTGQTVNLSGFRQVNVDKFHAMSPDLVMQWHKNRWTHFIYAHLFSAQRWNDLAKRLEQRILN
jgi:SapC